MASVAVAFAEVTAVLEDMHGIAVEGQSSDHDIDHRTALLAALRDGKRQISRLMIGLALALSQSNEKEP